MASPDFSGLQCISLFIFPQEAYIRQTWWHIAAVSAFGGQRQRTLTNLRLAWFSLRSEFNAS